LARSTIKKWKLEQARNEKEKYRNIFVKHVFKMGKIHISCELLKIHNSSKEMSFQGSIQKTPNTIQKSHINEFVEKILLLNFILRCLKI
jgi:hypothetical protein